MSIIKKGKNIIGVYKGSTPISNIYKGDLSVFELNVVYNVTATFNVTSTTEPTKLCHSTMTSAFTEMYVDGVQVDVTSGYTFSTTGEHTVNYMLADETTIADSTFQTCTSLVSVTIQDSIKTIGDSAFFGCSSLSSITIPDSVTSIGRVAFCSCSGLSSITIPDSVTSIGSQAFYNCSSLTSLTIPSSVTSIGQYAFLGCYFHIDNFINNSSATGYPWSAVIYDKIQDDGLCIYGTTAVGCKQDATNVTIPESITSIGDYAFYHCNSLSSITIPDSVTTIGDNAFQYCDGLTSVTIGDSVTSIGSYAFYSCRSLTSITIPDSVTSIGGSAFFGCSSLSSITIPDSVTEIGASAFHQCSSLSSITIPDSVTEIGASAFYSCTSLTSVDLGNGVTSIGGSAFYQCSGLTSITIPDSVTEIGYGSFNGCKSLTSVTIGSGVTSIDGKAFYNCSSLSSITCLATTAPTLGTDVFYGLPTNGTLTYPCDSDYSTWLTQLGWEDTCAMTYDITATFNVTSTTEPTTIANGNAYALSGFTKMCVDDVRVPVTDTYTFDTLGEHTVQYKLTDETTIGYRAFSDCTSLTSVIIGEGVTTIGRYAFYNCSGLSSITIPDSVTYIGGNAFYNCSSIQEITCLATTAPTLSSNPFNGIENNGGKLYVPNGSDYSTWTAVLTTWTIQYIT